MKKGILVLMITLAMSVWGPASVMGTETETIEESFVETETETETQFETETEMASEAIQEETSEDLEAVKDGLFTASDGSIYYYQNGRTYNKGLKSVKENGQSRYYYFDHTGKAFTGGLLEFVHRNGRTYYCYFGTDGRAYNKGLKAVTAYYYAGSDCSISKAKTSEKNYYYFKSNGIAFASGILEYSRAGKTYTGYFCKDGKGYKEGFLASASYSSADEGCNVRKTGYDSKKYYYFKENAIAARNITVEFFRNGKTYCMLIGKDGTGEMINRHGHTYSIDDSKVKILKNYYYGDANGILKSTVFKKDQSIIYHQCDYDYAYTMSMRIDGCGPTAIATLASIKKKVSPITVAEYMLDHEYIYIWEGSTREGIRKTLQHYGMSILGEYALEGDGSKSNYDLVFDRFNEYLIEGREVNMTLIVVKNSKNTLHDADYWTPGGHVINITNCRKGTDGVYYYFVEDPGAKKHNGWYTRDDLRYYVNIVWISEFK